MSVPRKRNRPIAFGRGPTQDPKGDPTAEEALTTPTDGSLNPHMSREFDASHVRHVREVLLPEALLKENRSRVVACEDVLRKHGQEVPNRTSGRWEPKDVPNTEVQLREMVASRLPDFGFRVVRSREAFPDWLLLDREGLYVRAEVEFRSSSFTAHGHDPSQCDLVVCWEHDDAALDLPILEWFTETLSRQPKGQPGGTFALTLPTKPAQKNIGRNRTELMVARRMELMRRGISGGDAVRKVAEEFGVHHNTVYTAMSRQRKRSKPDMA